MSEKQLDPYIESLAILARCRKYARLAQIDTAVSISREANKVMRDAELRAELIVKAAETKRRADQARVTLASDEFRRLNDRDWTTQLLAAGNTQKGRTRKGG
jgi:hypothetical protein